MRRKAKSFASSILEIVSNHEDYRLNSCINMICAENVTSKVVRKLISSDMLHRYSSPIAHYKGTKYIDEIENLANELAKEVFEAKYADVRPISGLVADMALLFNFVKKGDKVAMVSPEDGGFKGTSSIGIGSIIGYQDVYFAFDRDRYNIKVSESIEIVKRERPKLLLFGASYILFPQPVKEIVSYDKNTLAAYDASHVMGLIAGKRFQSPLKEGCQIIVGSTHKSFFGPQGGIILCSNYEVFNKIRENMWLKIVDNIHWNRVTALAYSLAEMLEFGEDYASQVIRNSKVLGKALDENGIPVKARSYGYSESHQVILDYNKIDEKERISKRLECAGIICDRGIRLGTSELTRRGMKEREMELIASLIADVLLKDEVEKVKREVTKLTKEFQEVHYTFN
jgi:glycine hydroxymethyltransferase